MPRCTRESLPGYMGVSSDTETLRWGTRGEGSVRTGPEVGVRSGDFGRGNRRSLVPTHGHSPPSRVDNTFTI